MTTEADKRVTRWGGLAGLGGGLLFIGVFAWVIILAGPDPAGPAGPITRFPEIRAVRTVENGLYLAVLALWVPAQLALRRALHGTNPAAATYGSTLNLVGLGVLAAGAVPHIVTSRLSDLYHAPGVSTGRQDALVVAWQAVQGLFDALLVTGLLLMAIGIIVIGSAMLSSPSFGKASGIASSALGVVALAAGIAVLIDPSSLAAAAGVIALIAFHLIIGWRVR
ncbi:hypothetical protein AB0C18_10225 [Nonomuraea muscovyensis]|uniref:hypothetical protein n=1 Tax=Nonomuraea muscovyensis TaxID=1124761 RepID=UPI003408CBEF